VVNFAASINFPTVQDGPSRRLQQVFGLIGNGQEIKLAIMNGQLYGHQRCYAGLAPHGGMQVNIKEAVLCKEVHSSRKVPFKRTTSPFLLAINEIILNINHIFCINNVYVCCLTYADDLLFISAAASSLHTMINLYSNEFASLHFCSNVAILHWSRGPHW
jgi:hypothetical protein